jgi:hypothetical protein
MAKQHEQSGIDPTIPAIAALANTLVSSGGPELFFTHNPPDATMHGIDRFRTFEDQRIVLDTMLQQAEGAPYDSRMIRGPQYAAFNRILQDVNGKLRAINSDLPPDALTPSSYQDPATTAMLDDNPTLRRRIASLRADRLAQLKLHGGRALIQLSGQDMPPGTLDAPPYHKQGEYVRSWNALRLCMNACFRMVHGGIAGWSPYEDLLANKIRELHGDVVVGDEVYYGLLQTKAFEQEAEHKVKIVEMLGADFETINKLATSVKQRHPSAKVFAVASLGSETSNEDTWHSVVLLHKNRQEVVCHDPALDNGRASRPIPLTDFTRRWAITYNRVQLAIAFKTPGSQ